MQVRTWLWGVALGLASSAWLAFWKLESRISADESSGGPSFSPSVLVRPRLDLFNTTDIQAALSVWNKTPAADSYVRCYLAVDLLVFIPGYCLLAWLILRTVGTSRKIVGSLVPALLVADVAETVLTLTAVGHPKASDAHVVMIQLFTFLKWALLLTALALLCLVGAYRAVRARRNWKGIRPRSDREG